METQFNHNLKDTKAYYFNDLEEERVCIDPDRYDEIAEQEQNETKELNFN